MKISLVTDEVSSDLETAIELGVEWGVDAFELRGIGNQRVPLFSDYQKQRVLELKEEFAFQIAAISPGLFKIPYPPKKRKQFSLQVIDTHYYDQWQAARRLLDYHIQELLPASIEYAKQVGARQIVAFGFERGDQPPGLPPDEILEVLQVSAKQVAHEGMQLSIEVEAGFWADTGERTAAMIHAVGEACFGVNWDPGNAFAAGDIPFPNGYQAVRQYVQHVHFKDAVRRPDGSIYHTTEGEIDWAGQIRALHEDGYQGFVSVEPHLQPKVASARAVTARLKRLIESNELPGG